MDPAFVSASKSTCAQSAGTVSAQCGIPCVSAKLLALAGEVAMTPSSDSRSMFLIAATYFPAILPVPRSREEAKRFYNRISRWYDYLTATSERKYVKKAVQQLSVQLGETVLEIGPGTGFGLKLIAQSVDKTGRVYGIDISSGMLKVARKKLEKARLIDYVDFHCGDATYLPYRDNVFDTIFMSFTLELFDTLEMPKVLEEIRRVLKSGGRLGVVSMSKENADNMISRLYEWSHKKWPRYVDCRPIYLEQSVIAAGYKIQTRRKLRLMGLPLEIVIAINEK